MDLELYKPFRSLGLPLALLRSKEPLCGTPLQDSRVIPCVGYRASSTMAVEVGVP